MAACRSRARQLLSGRTWSHLPSVLRFSSTRGLSSNPSVPAHLEKVGFIGLGNMGFHMASNLVSAGHKLTVHDINYTAMKKFSEKGIPTKETPFEVAESSDVIITMLPSASHVLDVYTGKYGLLQGRSHLRPWLFIDSSTVDPQTSRKLSLEISKYLLKVKNGLDQGVVGTPVMLDAPVSGGVLRAEAATLTFMVGGPEEAYLAANPLFLSMGKNIIYCGGPGNGSARSQVPESSLVTPLRSMWILHQMILSFQLSLSFGKAAKICNNLAMAVNMLGVSEAFALGQRLGITASKLSNIFNSSTARCWSSDSYNPVPGVMEEVPSSKNYDGGFSSKLMAKDLALAMKSAEEVCFKPALTNEAHHIYTEICNQGYESKDFSCAFRHYYSGKDEFK